jgi:ribosomal protein S27E
MLQEEKPRGGVRWICQECGTPMACYREGNTEVTECPNCGFTVIRPFYEDG